MIIVHKIGMLLRLKSLIACSMHVLNASKVYSNNPKRRNYHTKKGTWKVYFYDKGGSFRVQRVGKFKGWFIRLFFPKQKVRVTICKTCSSKFRYVGEPQCPKCI